MNIIINSFIITLIIISNFFITKYIVIFLVTVNKILITIHQHFFNLKNRIDFGERL